MGFAWAISLEDGSITKMGKTGGSTGLGSRRVIRNFLTAILGMRFLPHFQVEMSELDTTGWGWRFGLISLSVVSKAMGGTRSPRYSSDCEEKETQEWAIEHKHTSQREEEKSTKKIGQWDYQDYKAEKIEKRKYFKLEGLVNFA